MSEDATTLEPASSSVKRYQRLKLSANLASTIVGLLILTAFALVLGPDLGRWLRENFPEQRWVHLWLTAAALAVVMEVATLPLDFWSSFVVEHQYQLSNQTLGRWLMQRLKGWLVGGILAFLLISGLYAILWATGPWWWLVATAGWLLVTIVLGQLLPILILPLFYKVTRLEDTPLLDRLRHLADGTGLTVEGVYRLHLSEETKKANAALAGLGHTRRVLLGDTLLDQFTPEEIEVVFAHEVGHHVYRHLVKMIGLQVVLSLAAFWLVDVVLRWAAQALGYVAGASPVEDPAALPLLFLVLSLFGLVLSPLRNALSRCFERQCDRYALDRTANATAYRSAFTKLARVNKSDPDPHPWVVWLFYDHPAIRERLNMAAS